MFQERYPRQGPNFQPPNGPFRQQQRPIFQRMPQANRTFFTTKTSAASNGPSIGANVPIQQQTQ